MIVHRMTLYIKPGHSNEAVELELMEIKRRGWHRAVRFYSARVGRFDTLALEQEFENLTEYEQFWKAYWATPEATAFAKQWHALEAPGSTEELWELVV